MSPFEIDRALSKLIAKLLQDEWTPQEEANFRNLCADRTRQMNSPLRHRRRK